MTENSKVSGSQAEYSEIKEDHAQEANAGTICIHNDVIAVIAREAASNVDGVAELPGDFLDGIAGMIGRKSHDRGISVHVDGETVKIDLTVILNHKVRIPQVAWQLQQDVKESVEEMTGKFVESVDVIVQGIKVSSKAQNSQKETNE